MEQKKPNPERTSTMLHRLHNLVTYGPGDLDIAAAMAPYGYDATKWAEGQGVLAELVSCDVPPRLILAAAAIWYSQAAADAQRALGARPRLLAKLGLGDRLQKTA